MNTRISTHHRTRLPARSALSLAIGATLVIAPAPGLQAWAATATWSGLGVTPQWSEAANWSPAIAPVDGDAVAFAGSTPFATSVLDVSRSFSALTFATTAGAYALHVQGAGATELVFTGAGLRNLTAGSGPIRQTLFADAGPTGGTIRFSGNAGINLGTDAFRPVDLIASGGSTTGSVGGRLIFEGHAATSANTFDALRALGASVAGAGGGAILFRDDAVATALSTIALHGGSAPGALGATASFADRALAAGNLNLLAGEGGGLGSRAVFADLATASSGIANAGATSAGVGGEARTSFRGDARLTGTVANGSGGVAGASGGLLEFSERASLDASAIAPGTGTLIVSNGGASVAGAGGGATVFRDDTSVRGSEVLIDNATGEGTPAGSRGGTTDFFDRSHAGRAAIRNAGTNESGAVGGVTRFFNLASAENAILTMVGGNGNAAAGGAVSFGDDSTASAARLNVDGGRAAGALGGSAQFGSRSTAGGADIVNGGGTVAGALGGATRFDGTASGGTARIVNAAGAINGASGGVTTFSANAGAARAYLTNETSLGAAGGGRGSTLFMDTSSAQDATIDNLGGLQLINAFTVFSQTATAGNARITNFGCRAAGAGGGSTDFIDSSTANAASLVMAGGAVAGARGGSSRFLANASAGNATLDLRGASVIGAEGGTTVFQNFASADHAAFVVQGSQANNAGGPEGARVDFNFNTTAAQASFTIGGNLFAFGGTGRVQFHDASTAADASFVTLAGFSAGGRLSFEGGAVALASAGNASITNGSRAPGALSTGSDFGGATLFLARSTADHATITNAAGATAFGAQTVFRADSSAADAAIVNAGGRAGDTGGITFFEDTASAGRAVIVNRAGAAANASGLTTFNGTSSAAQSSITAAGALINGDIGGRVAFDGSAGAAQSTLVADGGTNGGLGGRLTFRAQSTGGTARLVLNAGSNAASGGTLDIGNVDVWLSVGSIEGGGRVDLGAKSLIVGSNGRATTFSGVIDGAVPAVFPSLSVLGGSLTLTGANTYAGRTSIGDGLNANSGKLIAANASGSATGSGAVLVQRGGTLAGSGNIDGPVTLNSGGTIAPGDPVTLTLRDSLTWDGGGLIRLVLGADDAGSDHLVVHSLVRGAAGTYAFELIDTGIVAGNAYELIRFDSLVGFTASDFSFAGSARPGRFSIADGALDFTAAAVPEPGSSALLVVGLLGLMGWVRRPRGTGPT